MDNNEQRDHLDEAATRRELEAEGEAELAEAEGHARREAILAAGAELPATPYGAEPAGATAARLRALADFLERHPELPALTAPQLGRAQDYDVSGQPAVGGAGRDDRDSEVRRLQGIAQYAAVQGVAVTTRRWTADQPERVHVGALLVLDSPATGTRYSLEVWTVVTQATLDSLPPAPERELSDGAVELEAERRGFAGAVVMDTAGTGELAEPLSLDQSRRFRRLAAGMPYGASIMPAARLGGYAGQPVEHTAGDVLDYLDRLRGELVDLADSDRKRGAELAELRAVVAAGRRVFAVLAGAPIGGE